MKSILITGGSGAFGQAFTERLLSDGLAPRVCIYSRSEFKQFEMRQRLKNDPRLRFMIGDVRDRPRLRRAMQEIDVVVHAAALKRIEVGIYNCDEMIKTNVDGSLNVVEAARDAMVSKVVLLSTDKAFSPVSAYGATKLLAETLFLSANENSGRHGPRFAVCRYGNVWGSTGSVGPIWSRMLEDGETHVPVTDPDATRFFMRMDQAVDLVLQTINTMRGGEIEIPKLPAYRLGDLAQAMGAKMIVLGMPEYEKAHESMSEGNCSMDAPRM